MTNEARRMSGVIFLSVPTIAFGGYFLLTILTGEREYMQLTEFQKSMFRAGHAHAGVLVILSLVAQILIDYANLSNVLKWSVRKAFPAAAILVSGGFLAGASGSQITKPNEFISILYLGVVVFFAGLLTLGIGLIRKQ